MGCLVLCVSARALAAEDPCPLSEPSWVRVVFSAGPEHDPLKSAMLNDLRAGLTPNQVGICAADRPGSAEPVALLKCTFSEDGLRVILEVVDRVTNQRVSRAIQLAALPADGRSLALAVESEELLRASWAERRLSSKPRVTPPSEGAPATAASSPRRDESARRAVLGARLGVGHFGLDQTQYGADAFTLIPLFRRASFEIAFGFRGMLSTASAHGTVTASAVNADLGLHLPWLRFGSFELDAQVSSHFSVVEYEAQATASATARAARGFAGVGRLGLGASFGAPHSLRSFTTLGAGYPWLSYSAADSGQTVTGTSGFEIFASTGLGIEL